jgi:hypothetical protein
MLNITSSFENEKSEPIALSVIHDETGMTILAQGSNHDLARAIHFDRTETAELYELMNLTRPGYTN